MAAEETRISLLVLIGLPGSGKTTFSNYLVKYLEDASGLCYPSAAVPYYIMTVCYDKIIPLSFNEGSQDDVMWSEARKSVVKSVEIMITKLKSCTDHKELADQHNFSISESKLEPLDHSRILVVIDDNMYYRSMRYQYYQIARSYNLGFCQAFLKCEVEECLKRNRGRIEQNRIPEYIIRRMADNLEMPDPCEYPWEKYSYVISSLNPFTLSTIVGLYETVNLAFTDPPLPLPSPMQRECSRVVCSSNVFHQVDLTLRKIIGNQIKDKRQHLSSKELGILSQLLNGKKQEILHSIKRGHLTLPGEISSAIEDNQMSAASGLYSFLSQQFVE